MFQRACSLVEPAVYCTVGGTNGLGVSFGTAFMIAPGVLATAAHAIRVGKSTSAARHDHIVVIQGPNLEANRMEQVTRILEDLDRDIALLQIDDPRSRDCVVLEAATISRGALCGSLSYPYAILSHNALDREFRDVLRFKSATVSCHYTETLQLGRQISFYEIDTALYEGSNGCPVFCEDGKVFGMALKTRTLLSPVPQGAEHNQGSAEKPLAFQAMVPSNDIIDFAARNGIALYQGEN